jgi:hypothetical protein
MKQNLWGYRGDDSCPFLKITINEARNLTKVRDKYPCNKMFLVLIFIMHAYLKEGSAHFTIFSAIEHRRLRVMLHIPCDL